MVVTQTAVMADTQMTTCTPTTRKYGGALRKRRRWLRRIYEGDEIYVAYDSVYWNRWTGDERIKTKMVAYYTELEE